MVGNGGLWRVTAGYGRLGRVFIKSLLFSVKY